MSPHPPVHVIAVYSRNAATGDFFKRALDGAGFAAFTAPAELSALETFLGAITPDAVVFDLSSGNESERDELVKMKSRAPCRDLPMVITTGDWQTLQHRLGEAGPVLTPLIEMFTHASDLTDVRAALWRVLKDSRSGRWRHSRVARHAS
jgi:hypothetical protein